MEFWGTEVTPGKPQANEPGDDTYVHVSQAALGPSKDAKSEKVVIRVESGGKNVVLGTLAAGKVDQMTLDLIFDREFKLSHSSTSSSVFFCGYRTDKGQEYDDSDSDEGEDEDEESDEEDEPVPTAVPIKQNGTVSAKNGAKVSKKESKVTELVVEKKSKKIDSPKPSLVDTEAEEGEESDEDDDDEDDEDVDKAMTMDFDTDDYDEEDDSEFEVDNMSGSEAESDDEDEDDTDEEEDSDEDDEDDVAAELGKKRSLQESAKKTLGEGKKPRLDTPAKPGSQTAAEHWESLIIAGRKGLVTTPGKKGGKGAVDTKSTTPVSTKKSEAKDAKTPQKTPGKVAKTPKSEKSTPSTPAGDSAKKIGAHHCAECSRNFASESALSQHAVAKHKK